jgi:CheY-like chemotaxis protein
MNELKILKDKIKNLKVIYAEDEDEMREGTEIFLNKFFTSVETAKDGQEALEKFKNCQYDIVFTDIRMPNMDGLTMLEKMREIDDKFIAIALTASAVKKEDIQKATALYFRKPISYNNMSSILETIVQKLNL